jgi:uncharacterized protein with GYD domain
MDVEIMFFEFTERMQSSPSQIQEQGVEMRTVYIICGNYT